MNRRRPTLLTEFLDDLQSARDDLCGPTRASRFLGSVLLLGALLYLALVLFFLL